MQMITADYVAQAGDAAILFHKVQQNLAERRCQDEKNMFYGFLADYLSTLEDQHAAWAAAGLRSPYVPVVNTLNTPPQLKVNQSIDLGNEVIGTWYRYVLFTDDKDELPEVLWGQLDHYFEASRYRGSRCKHFESWLEAYSALGKALEKLGVEYANPG